MIARRLKQWLQGGAPGSGPGPNGTPGQTPQARVLMVCMGNICRSPTAEGVLRAQLQQAGLLGRVAVDSAGTHGYHTGEAPDKRAIASAGRRGYDLTGLQARPVVEADFSRFDWMLCMDEANQAWVNKRRPAHSGARVALLMDFARHNRDVTEVPDPYYGGPAGFDRVLDLVGDACSGFVIHLAGHLASRPGEDAAWQGASGSMPTKLD